MNKSKLKLMGKSNYQKQVKKEAAFILHTYILLIIDILINIQLY